MTMSAEFSFGGIAPLHPDVKMNMKLDDIIKHEKRRLGVSHNLQFRQLNKYKRRGRHNSRLSYRIPFFYRKYRSQNWRLGGNGPHTSAHRNRLREFLERKWKTTPLTSVFQRLGYNSAAQRAARSKLSFARKITQQNGDFYHDRNRLQKLIASSKRYFNVNGCGNAELDNSQPSLPLNAINLQKLCQALGGHITSVREESDANTLTTIIKRKLPEPLGVNGMNRVNGNAFNDGASYGSFNDAASFSSFNNTAGSYSFNDQASYNPVTGITSNVFGSHAFGMNPNQMGVQGMNYGSNYEMQPPQWNNYNMMGSSFGRPQMFGTNNWASYGSNLMLVQNQSKPLNENLEIQREIHRLQQQNENRDTPPSLISGSIASVGRRSIIGNEKLAIHSTSQPCGIRFAAMNSRPLLEPNSMDF